MTVYKLPEMTVVALPDRPLSIALGNFDGVHIGHRRLLQCAREAAGLIPGCASAAWTFSALAKENPAVPSLTDPQEKLRQFAAAGLEYAIFEDFETVRHCTAAEFTEEYLLGTLSAAAVICGFNFRFGRGGTGDAALLSRILAGHSIPLTVGDPVMAGCTVVSSTRIRAAVADGDMETAAALLGRPFSICFPVLYGNQLGRTLGLPTINQNFPAGHIIPCRGIYACVCTVDGRRFAGVANVGIRPSVPGDGHINCETHILDYSGFLYGKSVRVEFCTRLRDERKFASLEELKDAIEADIRRTRDFFADKHLL